MMIYLPVMFEFDWTKCFSSHSPETEMLTDKRTKNGNTELHQFRKQLSYDGDLSLCQV